MYCAADAQRLPLQALIAGFFFFNCCLLPLAACPTAKAQPCVGPAVEMLVVQVARFVTVQIGTKQTKAIVVVVIIFNFTPIPGPLSTLRGQVGIGIINCSSGESPSRPWANLLRVKFPSAIALFNPFIRYLDHNPSRRLVRPAHASCGLAGPTRRRRSRTRPFRPPCRFRLALLG